VSFRGQPPKPRRPMEGLLGALVVATAAAAPKSTLGQIPGRQRRAGGAALGANEPGIGHPALPSRPLCVRSHEFGHVEGTCGFVQEGCS
jgi:hypothetical protein